QATQLFDSLGALRDCHVMMEGVEKLGPAGDPLTDNLLEHLRKQEATNINAAQAAIAEFDRKEWARWTHSLRARTGRLPRDSEVLRVLALEKLTAARRLQGLALKTQKNTTVHRLRITLKKFRYLVENFLPTLHEQWKDDLKQAQDLLGEIHDLDVLNET